MCAEKSRSAGSKVEGSQFPLGTWSIAFDILCFQSDSCAEYIESEVLR